MQTVHIHKPGDDYFIEILITAPELITSRSDRWHLPARRAIQDPDVIHTIIEEAVDNVEDYAAGSRIEKDSYEYQTAKRFAQGGYSILNARERSEFNHLILPLMERRTFRRIIAASDVSGNYVVDKMAAIGYNSLTPAERAFYDYAIAPALYRLLRRKQNLEGQILTPWRIEPNDRRVAAIVELGELESGTPLAAPFTERPVFQAVAAE